jgi:hypothetical protein
MNPKKTKSHFKLTNPRLRRLNVMVNSFHSCIPDATEEFSRTPEMSFPKVVSKPGMFLKKLISAVTLKQLKSQANAHSRGHLNKQVDLVSPNIEFINFEPFSVSNLSKKEFTIHSQPVKLEGVFCIFNFPHKVEGILSEAMLSRFQIHFLTSETLIRSKVLTMSRFNFKEGSIYPTFTNTSKELNFEVNGDSSPNLKVWVSSPWM